MNRKSLVSILTIVMTGACSEFERMWRFKYF